MPFSFLAGIGKVAGGIGSLIGATKKQKQPSPRDNIMSQAQGARDAAEEYGFNPLTLLQYGQPGGASPIAGGGTPPLASVEAITGGLEDIGDVVSGDAARRRAADQLQLDLAQIKLDQAQAGVVAGANGVGSGPSPLGRSASAFPTNAGTAHALRFDMGSDPIAPGREIDVDPVIDSPGVFRINNRGTFGPVWLPGDGEPWGADEGLTGLAFGGPQVARNYAKHRIQETADARGDPEKQKELRDKEMKRIFQHPPGWAGVFSRALSIYQ